RDTPALAYRRLHLHAHRLASFTTLEALAVDLAPHGVRIVIIEIRHGLHHGRKRHSIGGGAVVGGNTGDQGPRGVAEEVEVPLPAVAQSQVGGPGHGVHLADPFDDELAPFLGVPVVEPLSEQYE